MLANISVAWVIINMVPFGMALGYAYLPHNKNVHGLLVSLSWTVYAMCAICTRACASRLQPSARARKRRCLPPRPQPGASAPPTLHPPRPVHAPPWLRRCVLFCVGAMITKVAYGNPKFM